MEQEQEKGMSEIQRLLQELKDSIIGFENYKKFFDKVKSSDAVIITQITNRTREYDEYKQKYLEAVSKDSFKQMAEDGFITREVFELARMMNRNIMEAFNWKTLQEEMYSIIFNKIFIVLDDARALDIKRDALKEMKEMQKSMQEMFISVMENMGNMFKERVDIKLQSYDDKIFNYIAMKDEEHRKDRKEMIQIMKALFTEMNIGDEKRDELMGNLSKVQTKPKSEELFDKKEVPDKWKKEVRLREGVPTDYTWKKKSKDGEEEEIDYEKEEEEDIGEIDDKNKDILKKMGKKRK